MGMHHLVVGLLSLLLVRSADAQWRLDLSGGAFLAASTVTLTDRKLPSGVCCGVAGDQAEADFGAGGAYALGVGWTASDHVDAVAHFQHALSRTVDDAELEFGDFRTPLNTTDSELDVFSVTGGARFHVLPPGQAFRPWIVTEVGWYHANGGVEEISCGGRCAGGLTGARDDRTGDGFGFNAGGGFDVALTDALSVGLETRYHYALILGDFGFITTMATVGVHF